MADRSFYPRRGLSFGYNHCTKCAVRIPRTHSLPVCRCCAADADPEHPELGADTETSAHLTAPAPGWSITGLSRFPQMECANLHLPDGTQVAADLWWLPKGGRWVAQHPLEYPLNRLKSLTGRDNDSAT